MIGKGKELEKAKQLGEDLLKALAHGGELERAWQGQELLPKADPARLESAMRWLEASGLSERTAGAWQLTGEGHDRAVELLRAHRLVETYLAREHGHRTGDLHAEADRAEHYLSSEQINDLADSMNRPRFDPHGDPIPERAHDLHRQEQIHLADVAAGQAVRIAHIEDEPEEDFDKLMRLGLAVELPLLVESQDGRETIIELAGETIRLDRTLAKHIEVTLLPEKEDYPFGLRRLASLDIGESGRVDFISPACMGPERRRLLDFGMVPGSEVSCAFKSPFGSPVAYTVRGSTIGLRDSQARNIFITGNL